MEEGAIKGQKFLIRKGHRNFERVSVENEKNTRKMPNGLETLGGTLNKKRNKKK